jgi:hypothetical protein
MAPRLSIVEDGQCLNDQADRFRENGLATMNDVAIALTIATCVAVRKNSDKPLPHFCHIAVV